MTQNRRRRSQGGALEAKDIFRTLEENTYGGNKSGRRVRSELPVTHKGDGIERIKVKFDRASDKYPAVLEVKMTDGEWVKYRIDIQQPAFVAVMDQLTDGKWERGYPPEGK